MLTPPVPPSLSYSPDPYCDLTNLGASDVYIYNSIGENVEYDVKNYVFGYNLSYHVETVSAMAAISSVSETLSPLNNYTFPNPTRVQATTTIQLSNGEQYISILVKQVFDDGTENYKSKH